MSNMRAIILAAGRSTRMLPLTQDIPKCLLPIGEETILEYQLRLIRGNGISDIIIVNGFAAENVEKIAGNGIIYIYNKNFLTTNSIYSLFLAKDYLDSDVLLLNSDILVNKKLMSMLVDENFSNAIIVDFNKKLYDGEMNVKTSNGFVVEIGKNIPAKKADGESVQLCKFGEQSAHLLKNEIALLIENKHVDKFPAYAFKPVIEKIGLKAVDTESNNWFEIDTIDDYRTACGKFQK